MDKNLTIIDNEYRQWVKELAQRYLTSQLKAAVKVNAEQILYYWNLGKDIAEREIDNRYGSNFYKNLSTDLKNELPGAEGLSESNIRYCKRFYCLYNESIEILPQAVEELKQGNLPQLVEELCLIPWGHHRLIIDNFSKDVNKAFSG